MASSSAAASETTTTLFPHIESVLIDEEGVFKYVLLELKMMVNFGDVSSSASSSSTPASDLRYIVRGFAWGEYHDDIYQQAKLVITADPRSANASVVCVGGGRIKREKRVSEGSEGSEAPISTTTTTTLSSSSPPSSSPSSDIITIYGHSVGYGRSDHETSSGLIQSCFPSATVSWNNEGY